MPLPFFPCLQWEKHGGPTHGPRYVNEGTFKLRLTMRPIGRPDPLGIRSTASHSGTSFVLC